MSRKTLRDFLIYVKERLRITLKLRQKCGKGSPVHPFFAEDVHCKQMKKRSKWKDKATKRVR